MVLFKEFLIMTNLEIINFIKNLNIYKSKYQIYLKNHHLDIYNEILEKTKFLDETNIKNKNISFAERLYAIKNNLVDRPKCKCCNKNYLEFNTDISQYRNYCSTKCSKSSSETITKRRQSTIKKFGSYENFLKHSYLKRKKTCLEKYGVEKYNNYEKIRQTIKERYGSENYNNLEKYKKTCLEKYGVEFPGKNKEVMKKRIEKFKKEHNNCSSAFLLPEVIEKTKIGNRLKSWKFIKNNNQYEPNFTLDFYLSVKDIHEENCLEFKCKKCGTIFKSNWFSGNCKKCPICFPELHGTSLEEKDLINYLKTIYKNKIETNYKKLISPLEIDVYIPEKYLAIEFDGLYYHSENKNKDKNYHLNKTELCEKQGIQLIHIFENEWISKQEIVKSRLKNILGIYDKTIYARNCEVKEIDKKLSKEFQRENHIQGEINAKIHIGIFFKNELVSVMSFSKPRFSKKYEYEMIRFCSKLNYHVIGAAGKLLKYFEEKYQPKSIVSYADRRWSTGNLYKKLGFKLENISGPNYWYFLLNDNRTIFSRVVFQKHKQEKLLKYFDKNLTEEQNMYNNNYSKIFDCGNLVFVKTY